MGRFPSLVQKRQNKYFDRLSFNKVRGEKGGCDRKEEEE